MSSGQGEGDQAPKLPKTGSGSNANFLQKRVASRAPLFNDLDEAFKKITARPKPNENLSQKVTSPYAAGRSLTDKYTTPTKLTAPTAVMSTAQGQLDNVDQAPMVDIPLDGPNDTGSKVMRQHQCPSEPPKSSLPDTPHAHPQSELESKTVTIQPTTPTGSTVSDSQQLLNANEVEQTRQPGVPSQLKFPLKECLKNEEDYRSESSSANNTTVSNLDPFHYDDQRYQAFMHPDNERDVSRALKRLSHVGEASEATLFTPEASPTTKATGNHFAQQPVKPALEKKFRDLRVEIGRKPELEPEEDDAPGRLTRSKACLRLDKLARQSTGDGGDWVTEATTETGFGHSPIVKRTGSSIAYFSDEEEENTSNTFNAIRRPVLWHPSARDNAQPESYELHNLKQPKQQVMLPKTKYSVFPMNSDRLLSSGADTLPHTISNPFSKNAYKRADGNGNFTNLVKKGATKYEFRDSVSEYAQPSQLTQNSPQDSLFDHNLDEGVLGKYLRDGEQANTDGFGSERQTFGSSRDVEATPRKRYQSRHVDEMYPARHRFGHKWRLERQETDSSDFADYGRGAHIGEPLSSRSKFEFELVSLEQAQLKQKQQRESGETDETRPQAVRSNRAKSNSFTDSSPITLPPPTVNRRMGANLSTDFSYQSWTNLEDALMDTPSPFSATQQTPQSSAADRSLLRHHGSPMTPSATPTRKFFGRYRPRLFFSPAKEQPQRVASDQPTLNHNPLPHLESGLSLAAMETIMESSISEEAKLRRARWFYLMATLSILLPFFAILVLSKVLDESLVWYTKGEVRTLTIKQRNFIRAAFLVELCLFVILIASIIAVFTKKN
ncbi:hypothetical protein F4821DRAFT_275772 [Hypoxylon rubiginosum]|uniref:Uncharacterized protein n=1 Tax=Hypoxylon rubiginosum TaxID=110542 RepID=A0ACC0DAH5_9PEZI|nr:hypothetical protein F4821DRAFT_275772 [Hypoxylon rubiginosum]